jgi:hypothetical protein
VVVLNLPSLIKNKSGYFINEVIFIFQKQN